MTDTATRRPKRKSFMADTKTCAKHRADEWRRANGETVVTNSTVTVAKVVSDFVRRFEQPVASGEADVARFFAGLEAFDRRLGSGVPLCVEPERLFQGPVADALTHVGQIAMLRRMAGCPMSGENYFVAAIETGRVGADQAAPVKVF